MLPHSATAIVPSVCTTDLFILLFIPVLRKVRSGRQYKISKTKRSKSNCGFFYLPFHLFAFGVSCSLIGNFLFMISNSSKPYQEWDKYTTLSSKQIAGFFSIKNRKQDTSKTERISTFHKKFLGLNNLLQHRKTCQQVHLKARI